MMGEVRSVVFLEVGLLGQGRAGWGLAESEFAD